jgi:hypothetical protein
MSLVDCSTAPTCSAIEADCLDLTTQQCASRQQDEPYRCPQRTFACTRFAAQVLQPSCDPPVTFL